MVSSHQSSGATFANPAPCNVHVTPQRPLIDEVLHIRVSDAGKHKPITMLARMEDDGKRVFSYAHYTTDELGQLDLRKSACQGGFYKGTCITIHNIMCYKAAFAEAGCLLYSTRAAAVICFQYSY